MLSGANVLFVKKGAENRLRAVYGSPLCSRGAMSASSAVSPPPTRRREDTKRNVILENAPRQRVSLSKPSPWGEGVKNL